MYMSPPSLPPSFPPSCLLLFVSTVSSINVLTLLGGREIKVLLLLTADGGGAHPHTHTHTQTFTFDIFVESLSLYIYFSLSLSPLVGHDEKAQKKGRVGGRKGEEEYI